MGDREGIIMFPLLSRLPQLSLKRDSQTACLLIHLNFSNKSPPHVCLFLPSHFLPLLMHFLITNFYSYRCSPNIFSSPRASAMPPPPACLPPAASPHLSALRGFNREPSTPTFLLIIPPPCFAAGLRERKKMMRMSILACTQPEEK